MINTNPRDWHEDFSHENGQYMCVCCNCEKSFIGHKRRVTCKLCEQLSRDRWEAMTDDEKQEQMKDVNLLIDSFLEKK